LPEPLPPDVTVIHPLLLEAVHEQPESDVTPTDPVVADALTDLDAGDVEYVQVGVPPIVKVFEGELAADPPGPTAVTRASYVPAAGHVVTIVDRSTVITLLASGAGLPSAYVCTGVLWPTT
jgi:hypothetical protein